MKVVWTDRSRILEYQRCNRRRYLAYHQGGMGLAPKRTPLPLAVGSAVHSGLAVLLREGQRYKDSDKYAFSNTLGDIVNQRSIEELAVKAALAELATHADGLELDLSEQAAQGSLVNDTQALLERSIGEVMSDPGERIMDAKQRADEYLWNEQSALVEGLVRAYARRKLKSLLEQYEVLEVEREGDWQLASAPICQLCGGGGQRELAGPLSMCSKCLGTGRGPEIRFASRPDALLRDRESNQLYIQSFKTAASWDIRKERDAERDMQGLSEGVEVERRLGELWASLKGNHTIDFAQTTEQMCKWLLTLDSPPRILGIRMEYMFKGDRWKDKDLTRDIGIECRVQKSPLVRAYLNSGMASGDEQWCHSYDYHKDDGSTSKLYWKTWRPAAVWEHMPIKKWIDMLDETVPVQGEEGRELGWQGPAQAAGYTDGHPLDEVFHPPIVVFRRDDQLRDWFESTEAQERRVAESVEQICAAGDEAEKRHLLNVLMPQSTSACSYPSECPFIPICFGPDHVRQDPMGTGRYKIREANHPQEEASCASE